ncbi:uncharacterized protein [Pocillopora verrucosa]|uniref:uncharacterized protein n=1 Tax=Pocillopora verrucosa TaxID=203993 RepID=UPI00333F0B3F
MALRKTAEMGSEQYPDAAKIVKYNTYMDDIIETKLNFFSIRKRGIQKDNPNNDAKLTPPLTKRMISSQVNSMYDPLGLAGPFTVLAKILMRHLWATSEKLDWDDPIPEDNKQQWSAFFNELPEMNQVKFERCLKPSDAVCNPILIIFCDASEDAYGSCAIPTTIMKVVNTVNESVKDDLASRIKIERFSDCKRLLRVTARILKLYRRKPKAIFKNATQEITSKDVETAEVFWIKEAQRNMKNDIKHGTYRRLCPRLRDDGIYVISGRAEKWLEIGYNKEDIILLPYQHRFARLYCEYIHAKGHHGVLTTASKIRARFWITQLLKMIQSVKLNCVTCKKLDKKLSGQVMGNLPKERLKPAPPWYSTSLDLFGPFTIRDAIKKRTTLKAYGVIFNCIGTRAVYLDLAPDYSTESFLMVLRRFVSLRGYPS